MRATQRLAARGYEAYLVGGCVRDLLLGRSPKDYDMATGARPQQVKRTFPHNCRIIGRRFKLAHLHFHGNTKILEVSTFRRTPQMDSEDDLLITRDNEFGNAEEDALRRDFTVNALFLDPLGDRILDYAGGLPDVRARIIRTIGDPRVRFREDPVRILRAAKFAGRLGFHVEGETLAAMAACAPDLARSAPPRLLEEIQRLLRGGHALESFQLLRDVGALKILVPALAEFLGSAPQPQRVEFWRVLEAMDHCIQDGRALPNPVLLGALFLAPVSALCTQNPERSRSTVAEEVLGPVSQHLRLPRRDAGCLKRIIGVQPRFQTGGERRFKPEGFVHSPYFAEALDLFELWSLAVGRDPKEVARWREMARTSGHGPRHHDVEDFAEGEGEAGAGEGATAEPGSAGEAGETDDPFGGPPDPGQGEPGPGRRRRRRRRGRRGRGDREQDDVAPVPAMAGEEREEEGAGADEPQTEAVAAGPREEASPHDGPGQPEESMDAGAQAPVFGEPEAPGEPGRRRRRRRRRGRGDRSEHGGGDRPRQPMADEPAVEGAPTGGDQEPGLHGPPEGDEAREHGGGAEGREHGGQGHQHGGGEGRRSRRRRRGRGASGGGGAVGGSGGGGGGDQQRPPRDRDRRGRRHERRGRGDGGDVDVVRRDQDRRGKVDVIEPQPMDLSAFDHELDPKRAPTFGSILEGQQKKKKRPVPDDRLDNYKPPPPPGKEGPEGTPPAPSPDEFGDW